MEQYSNLKLMKSKLYLIAFSFLICSFNVPGQLYESIEKEAANVLLSKNNPEEKIDLGELKTILFSDIYKTDFEKTYNLSLKDLDSLKNHLTLLETESESISVDSALFLFNQWYLQLSNTFYDYCMQKFFSSPKTKIILFSTSMSCYCTLEMCKNQTIDILKFVKENNDEYDYWIIDSYEHNELQIKYETLFSPSVLVLDENNEIIIKIEYENDMIDKLAVFLNGKNRIKG